MIVVGRTGGTAPLRAGFPAGGPGHGPGARVRARPRGRPGLGVPLAPRRRVRLAPRRRSSAPPSPALLTLAMVWLASRGDAVVFATGLFADRLRGPRPRRRPGRRRWRCSASRPWPPSRPRERSASRVLVIGFLGTALGTVAGTPAARDCVVAPGVGCVRIYAPSSPSSLTLIPSALWGAVGRRARAGSGAGAAREGRADHRSAESGQRVATGTLTIPAGTTGKGTVVAQGPVVVLGTVEGSVVSLGGDVTVRRGGHVTGDALSVGGRVLADSGRVDGEIRTMSALPALLDAPAPVAEAASPARAHDRRRQGRRRKLRRPAGRRHRRAALRRTQPRRGRRDGRAPIRARVLGRARGTAV